MSHIAGPQAPLLVMAVSQHWAGWQAGVRSKAEGAAGRDEYRHPEAIQEVSGRSEEVPCKLRRAVLQCFRSAAAALRLDAHWFGPGVWLTERKQFCL